MGVLGVAILKQMGDSRAQTWADATSTNEAAIKSFEELIAADSNEVDALTTSIETKITEIEVLGVALPARTHVGETIGICEQMRDSMARSWAVATPSWVAEIKSYEELMAGKSNEVDDLAASIATMLDMCAGFRS